jgi:hypothetical protein
MRPWLPDHVKNALAASVPFPKRLGDPDEYAALAEFMVTAGYFNGECVRLDGAGTGGQAGQKSSMFLGVPHRVVDALLETITISASSPVVAYPSVVSGLRMYCIVSCGLDVFVLELELSPPRLDEHDLLQRLVPVAVGALAAGVLRHPPVRDRDLLGTDGVGDAAHLAGVVAQPVVDVLELHDLVIAHGQPPLVCEYRTLPV